MIPEKLTSNQRMLLVAVNLLDYILSLTPTNTRVYAVLIQARSLLMIAIDEL